MAEMDGETSAPSRVFESLAGFTKIVVTGPQRSGTTICANMIAHDLGLPCVDERGVTPFWLKDRGKTISRIKAKLRENRLVLQSPSAAAFCHELPANVAVVYMIRPVEDIIKSQQRINWDGNPFELMMLEVDSGESCVLKYERWKWQKPLIKHAFEVEYESLKAHPLWVDAELRKNFTAKQIRVQ